MKNNFFVSFEEVVSLENLCEAWWEFIRGKRNKKDVMEFMQHLGDELVAQHADLVSGDYAHGPYQSFSINDPKPRSIHKATVRDRLLHHAIHRKLYPFIARTFISDSYSCQLDKGMHRAIDCFRDMARSAGRNDSRTCWILKCDIRKFFASIHHDILISMLAARISDGRLLDLLEGIIRSFKVMPGKGLPLGNLTSQLFANVYMHEFDLFVKQTLKARRYIRYADDFVILSDDREELLRHLSKMRSFLSERLMLDMHPDKISIGTLSSGADFLGWVHFPHHRLPRTKTKRRMLKRIKDSPRNESLQSYIGLLRHGDAHELESRLLNEYWYWRE